MTNNQQLDQMLYDCRLKIKERGSYYQIIKVTNFDLRHAFIYLMIFVFTYSIYVSDFPLSGKIFGIVLWLLLLLLTVFSSFHHFFKRIYVFDSHFLIKRFFMKPNVFQFVDIERFEVGVKRKAKARRVMFFIVTKDLQEVNLFSFHDMKWESITKLRQLALIMNQSFTGSPHE